MQSTLLKERMLLQEKHLWKDKEKWRKPYKIIFPDGNIKGGG
jgi:hypothetical protein